MSLCIRPIQGTRSQTPGVSRSACELSPQWSPAIIRLRVSPRLAASVRLGMGMAGKEERRAAGRCWYAVGEKEEGSCGGDSGGGGVNGSSASLALERWGLMEKRKVEVAVAALATVVLGVGNRVLYKLALVPLKQYPFFLAQLATVG